MPQHRCSGPPPTSTHSYTTDHSRVRGRAVPAGCVRTGGQIAAPQSEGAPEARFHDRELRVVSAPVGRYCPHVSPMAHARAQARAHAHTHACPPLGRAHTHMRIHTQLYARAAGHSTTGMRARADARMPVRMLTHSCTRAHSRTYTRRAHARTLMRTPRTRYMRPLHAVPREDARCSHAAAARVAP
jgi:hypothetical protein